MSAFGGLGYLYYNADKRVLELLDKYVNTATFTQRVLKSNYSDAFHARLSRA